MDTKQWSISHLVAEQIALQYIHEKYLPNLPAPKKNLMERIRQVGNILNIQDRIVVGCKRMGLVAEL